MQSPTSRQSPGGLGDHKKSLPDHLGSEIDSCTLGSSENNVMRTRRSGSLTTDGKNNGLTPNGTSNKRCATDSDFAHQDHHDHHDASFRHSLHFLRPSRIHPQRIRNRLMQKNGICNIQLVNVPKQGRKYFSDIFTTIVEIRWRWCLCLFALSYVLSWLTFALIFYLVALSHGDMTEQDEAWEPCVTNARNFWAILMFSMESQSTIGYGSRFPTEQCPMVTLTVFVQNIVGVITQTVMAGVVFAKLCRPKKRAETILFSKTAVICMRNGKLCLMLRLGDMRQQALAEAHVRLQMVKKVVTAEGELQPFHQCDMNVGYDTGLDRVFVIWPITICHVIDEQSPMYDVCKDDIVNNVVRFELIAILEGVVGTTGSTMQARTSYLPSEILWGHRFEKLVTYQRDNGEYRIDYGLFHSTYEAEIPGFSARQLNELEDKGLDPMRVEAEQQTRAAQTKTILHQISVTNADNEIEHHEQVDGLTSCYSSQPSVPRGFESLGPTERSRDRQPSLLEVLDRVDHRPPMLHREKDSEDDATSMVVDFKETIQPPAETESKSNA